MFELRWQEFGKDGRIVNKRKAFETESKLQKYLDKLETKDNFYRVTGYR